MAKDQLRILLVDDHEVVRDGVKALINASEGLIVVGEAGSVREAIDQAMRTKPDVVVMDVRLADGSGIEATREIRARLEKTQVLMLTSFADDEALFASIMAGAAGYVLKQIRGGELIRAIREVGAGNSLLDPEVTRSVLERLRKGKTMRDEKLARLTAQEERILTLVAQGLTNGQIGKELKLAEKTVKNYVSDHPLKARGGSQGRSRRLSGPPHEHPRVSVKPTLRVPAYFLAEAETAASSRLAMASASSLTVESATPSIIVSLRPWPSFPSGGSYMPLTVSRVTALSTGASSILPVIFGNSCSGNVAFQSRGMTVHVAVCTGSPSVTTTRLLTGTPPMWTPTDPTPFPLRRGNHFRGPLIKTSVHAATGWSMWTEWRTNMAPD